MVHSPIQQRWFGVIVSLAASFTFATHGAEKPVAELDGVWKIVSIELEGESRPIDEDVRWVIQGEKVLYGDEPLAAVTCYPASTPKGID